MPPTSPVDVRLQFGMASAFASESCPASRRNRVRLHVGNTVRHLSESSITAPLLVPSSARASDDSIRQVAPRTELYQIQTLTLSDQQFLKGDNIGATPVAVAGQLRIAQGTGRLPVVVIQHASSGYDARIDVWSRDLKENTTDYPSPGSPQISSGYARTAPI
jgi:hypothetical protein